MGTKVSAPRPGDAHVASETTKGFPADTLAAVLIALFTCIAALLAWRASVASGQAGDADSDGLAAMIGSQEVQCLGTLQSYAHAQVHAAYRRNAETSDALDDALTTASPAEKPELKHRQDEAQALVDAKLKQFPNKFMDPEGRYKVASEVGEYVSNQSRTRDLVAKPHFDIATRLREKQEKLLLAAALLCISLPLLTLVSSVKGKGGRYAGLVFGTLLGLGCAAYAVMVELGRI